MRSWRLLGRPKAQEPLGRGSRACWVGVSSPSRNSGQESLPPALCRAPPPVQCPTPTPGRFLRSKVGPGGHTQVPLRVRVQLRVQGPTVRAAASHNQHGVLVILQSGLGIPFHGSVVHLPRQRQLELFPKIGGRRLETRAGQSARVNTRGMQTPGAPSHGAPKSTPGSTSRAPGTSKEAPPPGTGPQNPPPPSPSHPPHHGAGPPAQQGHQVAVLAQQVQRGVRGVAPLALEGDEDGSARELQQPAQALPAGA